MCKKFKEIIPITVQFITEAEHVQTFKEMQDKYEVKLETKENSKDYKKKKTTKIAYDMEINLIISVSIVLRIGQIPYSDINLS